VQQKLTRNIEKAGVSNVEPLKGNPSIFRESTRRVAKHFQAESITLSGRKPD
jgi:hypothetical protein